MPYILGLINKELMNEIASIASNPRNAGHLIWDKLCSWSAYLSIIGMVLLTIIDIENIKDQETNILGVDQLKIGLLKYYFSVAFALFFGVLSVFNTRDSSKLEREGMLKDEKIADLENSLNQVVEETNQLFNSYLRLLTKSLGFGHNERISVYKIYNNEFVRIGRTSENPTLKNSGRKSYPIDEGLIGKCWSEGECFIDNLPNPLDKGGTLYFNAMNSVATIPKRVIENLNMKSRTYYIFRFEGFDSEPKAILVAESRNPTAFTKEKVLEQIEGIRQPLIMFIEKINNPNATSQQGLNQIGI